MKRSLSEIVAEIENAEPTYSVSVNGPRYISMEIGVAKRLCEAVRCAEKMREFIDAQHEDEEICHVAAWDAIAGGEG